MARPARRQHLSCGTGPPLEARSTGRHFLPSAYLLAALTTTPRERLLLPIWPVAVGWVVLGQSLTCTAYQDDSSSTVLPDLVTVLLGALGLTPRFNGLRKLELS
jgi:hypothetical protein